MKGMKARLTAATVTDAQIRALHAWLKANPTASFPGSGLRQSWKEALEDCEHALKKRDRHWTRFQRGQQHNARVRCAELVNARAEGGAS